MAKLHLSSKSGQLAKHLRQELLQGRWSGYMPGRDALAKELEVSPKIVSCALQTLEDEGLLQAQGPGRRRMVTPTDHTAKVAMRVGIMVAEESDANVGYMVDLRHRLEDEGFKPVIIANEIVRSSQNAKALGAIVLKARVDAWILMAASKDTLEWFSKQPAPAFALFGRRHSVTIPSTGPDKAHAMQVCVRRLIELGHRRIVMIAMRERRLPQPGLGERVFLEELEAHGILTSSYHLPDWEENALGLQRAIANMFRITPPTALIMDGPAMYLTVQQHVTRLGYRVPEDVSMICTDGDPYFEWQHPTIAHMNWDSTPWVRHAVAWAKDIAKGRCNLQKHMTKCKFVEGGTIGPAPRS